MPHKKKPLLNTMTHLNKHLLSCSWVCELAGFCWSRLGLAVGFKVWVALDWGLAGLGSRLWVQFRPFHEYCTEGQPWRGMLIFWKITKVQWQQEHMHKHISSPPLFKSGNCPLTKQMWWLGPKSSGEWVYSMQHKPWQDV